MIASLRQLTILKRLFIMLILAAIGTVCFGSFSVKEQYNNLVNEKYHQLASNIVLFNATVNELTAQNTASLTITTILDGINQQAQNPIYLLDDNKQLLSPSTSAIFANADISTLTDINGQRSLNVLLDLAKSQGLSNGSIEFNINGNAQTHFLSVKYDNQQQHYVLSYADNHNINTALKDIMIDYLIIMIMISLPIFLFFLLLNHSITQPINTAIKAMHGIAAGEGDLRQRLDENGKDEVSELAKAFNLFVIKIANVVGELNPIGNQLTINANELLTAVNTSQQSSQNVNQETQSVAAAIHEMLTTTQDMARNTQQAAENAHKVTIEAKHGQQLMLSTVVQSEALGSELQHNVQVSESLSQASNEISSILDVIKAIADQTNLLALNAAIEAARAGSHGRGFAVVADEVRALANRTQHSTNEINQIVSKIHQGIESLRQSNSQTLKQSDDLQLKARQSSDSMASILTLVDNINDMTSQLASATEQQAMVTEEVNININAISSLTHQVVAANESNEHEANELEKISQKMDNTLKQFKI
ncbi:methyl-accepting chemotaxis protein [Shewanella sp. OMA3-2]|uniref:methyl-accepting chemotaxis protein n=1 Tax=Shewanella sp. OMA3-2 TaxID=2908650 RepID=UPI001F3B8EB0|nr:methyl-accepting chemotaxis protein [Shewanella sp. OMA3-2]UJF20992.1 methyl-accepting chemotaxis protein [Shewanella sp. OMA3-2]